MAVFENIDQSEESVSLDYAYGEAVPEPTPDDMQSEESRKLLNQLEEWYDQERLVQAANRYEMAMDEDYFDSIQWSDEDRAALEARGQPALVFNEIAPAVKWITGTEKRTKIDWNVLPRGEEDVKPAQAKVKLLKYLSDVNKSPFVRSRAFGDTAKVGIGWTELGIRSDESDEPLFHRYENWRFVYYDHLSVEADLSDARYLFREKWVDLDIALAMFPEHANEIRAAATAHNLTLVDEDDLYYQAALYTDSQGRPIHTTRSFEVGSIVNNRRSRVKLIEAWYRKPCRCKIMRMDDPQGGTDVNGWVYDPQEPDLAALVNEGYASIYDAIRMTMHMAVFIKGTLLQAILSPYRHNRFPLVPRWYFRRGRDNAPYGAIRSCRDPQDDLNKRRSKAQYILSTNRVIMDEGAVEDEEALREEAADPAGIIKKKKGYELRIESDRNLGREHLELSREDAEYIRNISGVTAENQGRETNATSGYAINLRQQQGSIVTADIFDNHRLAHQIEGEIALSLIEQFYTKPKVVRLLGEKESVEFVRINQQDDVENDITRSQADFVVSEQDFRESLRLVMFEQMTKMMSSLPPEIAIQFLDVIFDLSDIPGKEEAIRRIRKINGQRDQDEPLTPEEQSAIAQQQEEADFVKRLERLVGEAKARVILAQAAEKEAAAQGKRVDTFKKAVETAQLIAPTPGLAPAADSILEASTGGS